MTSEPIIMIPGLGSDAAVWNPTIAALGPGHACTVGDTLADDSLAGMAARILAAAPPRFALAGVSMGGMIAMQIIEQAPQRVTRLALFDTNARADTAEQAARRRSANAAMQGASDLAALAGPAIAYMVHPATGPEVREALTRMTLRVGAAAYVRQNTAVAQRGDSLAGLARIAVPSLVAVGAQDLMTPPAMSREIAAAIPGAQLHVIPDCGHLPPIEQPAATARLLRGWLDQG